MANTRDPLRQLMDVVVYAPIGLMLLARQELPNLAAAGRNRVDSQLTLARFVGKLAVNQGVQTLQARFGTAAADRTQPARDRIELLPPAPVVETIALDITPSHAIGEAPAPIAPPIERPRVPESDRSPEADATPLPIEGYDSLAASQVVGRLPTLNDAELEAILRHEQAHRARRTILGKITQLRAR